VQKGFIMARNLLAALPGLLVFLAPAVTSADEKVGPAYRLVKEIKVGGEGGWDYLTMDPEARRLYISRATRVQVLDVEKGTIVGEVANTLGVHGIALVPKLNRGFTSNGRDATVTIFDLQTLKEIDRVKVGKGPDAIIYDPATGRVFTFNAGDKDATAIDAADGKVVGSIPLGGKPEFAVSDEKGRVYVNIEDKNEVLALDAQQLTVKERWPVAPGKEPAGLSMDRDSRRLFVTCHNNMMVVLDADSGRVVATPKIGSRTDAAAFDAGTKLAFSSNGDGTLTVVHEETPDKFEVVGNVKTKPGARTMALDPKTHTIYLVTAKFKPAPAAQKGTRQRPVMEPDTFEVLVVAREG
jgi:DNA-binding beta-propeller fold protein YncE